jgi:alkylated DNA repair dioxygenase AlkB
MATRILKNGEMDLFSDKNSNLLTSGGTVNYYGKIMPNERADQWLKALLENISWRNDEAFIFGRWIITKRKVAWYGDKHFEYSYSNTIKRAIQWTPDLLVLKEIVERVSGESFNSCLLNLYHDGNEGVGWHSDGEKDLKENGAIASLSLGAERRFLFRNKKSKETISVFLEHGSLLVMKDATQKNWLHRLPPDKTITRPRVNLTFRTIIVDY